MTMMSVIQRHFRFGVLGGLRPIVSLRLYRLFSIGVAENYISSELAVDWSKMSICNQNYVTPNKYFW